MERKFTFEVGEFYHIYNRGVEKRRIFLGTSDYDRFLELLYLANGDKPIVFKRVQGLPLDKERGVQQTSIVAYSLMPNHFHIVAREDAAGGLSKFMSKLSTSYSMYFNRKNDRSGALLCHPFRAKHVDSDEYFRWLMLYVHLNSLDIFEPEWKEKSTIDFRKATEFLRSYKYSSYIDYALGERRESKIISKETLPISLSEIETAEEMLNEFKSTEIEEGEVVQG